MSEEVFDLDEFLERVQDDKELLLELLDIFEADYGEKRKAIATAIEGSDSTEVRNIAHSLKGAAGNISAKRLRETFYKMEEMGKEEKLDGAQEVLDEADKNFSDLREKLQEVRQNLKP